MFGKPLREYLRFQKTVLIALVVVGLARLALSVAGLPNSTVKWLAMNAVLWAGVLYYGVAVHTRRFGSYKQLLALTAIQTVVFQAIAGAGILLAILGVPNIFAAPEYSFQTGNQWVHLLSHVTIGIVVATLIQWGVASLVLLITRKVRGGQPVPVAERG